MKQRQKPRYWAPHDPETRLFLASCVAAEALAGTSHLIPGTTEPRPRMLQWSYNPEGLLVATDGARYILREKDEAGLHRLASMMRTEFVAGVVGCC